MMAGGMTAGCGSGMDAASGTASNPGIVVEGTDLESSRSASQSEPPEGGKDISGAPQAGNREGAENTEGGQEGRWHVLDPETAEAAGADFLGKVRKLEEDSFWIVEVQVKILEDGSMVSSSPSSDAEIPDSELIQVVFDEDTHFYVRSIFNGGESYEDSEASFKDLEEKVSVDLKGSFVNDVFHASEVQINKIA